MLNVTVTQGLSIFQFFTSKYESLLIWWYSLLVLDFCLYILNGITGHHLQRDGLACG
ncbi:hypothetical protein GBAR_LOCUS24944, partial [Geodia barretti]